MADQGLWFKLWCSVLDDPDLDNLEMADFGRWAKLGALVKRQGTQGTLTLSAPARGLCALFQVPDFAALVACFMRFPHVHVRRDTSPVSSETGASVTFDNWLKYQGDFSTPRVMKFRRLKRSRGEEKRREETRGEETRSSPSDTSYQGPPVERPSHAEASGRPQAVTPPPTADWPEALHEVRQWLVTHNAPPQLLDPVYWQRIDDWLGAPDSGVGYLDELAKYLAWLAAQPRSRGHVDLKRGFRNWLAKSEYWSQSRAQTETHRRDAQRRR